jgi:hypothetical protein
MDKTFVKFSQEPRQIQSNAIERTLDFLSSDYHPALVFGERSEIDS